MHSLGLGKITKLIKIKEKKNRWHQSSQSNENAGVCLINIGICYFHIILTLLVKIIIMLVWNSKNAANLG